MMNVFDAATFAVVPRHMRSEQPEQASDAAQSEKRILCANCQDIKLAWEPSSDNGVHTSAPIQEMRTTSDVWQAAARDARCLVCTLGWKALECYPPPNGWPPASDGIKIRWRVTTAGNLRLEYAQRPEMPSHILGLTSYMRNGDGSHSIEICRGAGEFGHGHPLTTLKQGLDHADKRLMVSDRVSKAVPSLRRPIAKSAGNEAASQVFKTWLSNCIEKHEACKPKNTALLPSRVLHVGRHDTDRVFLQDGKGRSGPYVVLSYCWGEDATLRTTKDNLSAHLGDGLSVEELPATIRDAVQVVRELDVEFLWVDALCIIQDDASDWAVEASRMCDVYGDSYLCISADCATNVQDGFLRGSANAEESSSVKEVITHGQRWIVRPSPKHSSLATYFSERLAPTARRAWTLQEQEMPQRLLHFTHNELVWECTELTECECQRDSSMSVRTRLDQAESIEALQSSWTVKVQEYQTRAITHETDKLPALSGLARQYSRQREQLGEPTRYLAGLWEYDLAEQLCWLPPIPSDLQAWTRNNSRPLADDVLCHLETILPDTRQIHRVQGHHAPTWSWASLMGPVSYFASCPPAPLLSHVKILSSEIELLDASDEFGRLQPGSNRLTISGPVVSSLRLGLNMIVFDAGPAGDNFLLTGQDGDQCTIWPDDPNDVKENLDRYRQDLKCLLIGTKKVLRQPGVTFALRPMQKPDHWCEISELCRAGSHYRWLKEQLAMYGGEPLPGHWQEMTEDRDVDPNRTPLTPGLPEAFETEDEFNNAFDTVDNVGEDGEDQGTIVNFVFIMVLGPSADDASVYQRLAMIHAGIGFPLAHVMKEIFRRSRQETLTIA